jgi:hypothetical protein
VLLSEIVTRVSGVPFAEYVEQQIFKPLGMEQSLFLDNPSTIIKNRANSYALDGSEYLFMPMNRTVLGSTGLHTTSHDLSIWAMNYNNPKVGSQAIYEKMLAKSVLNSGEEIPYGLGIETKKYKGMDVVFHGGGAAGYRAYFLRVPAFDFSVVVTGNFESFNPLDIAYGMIDVFLSENTVEPKQTVIPSYSTKELEKYTGEYQIFPGLFIQILAENEELFFQAYGSDEKLILPVLKENEFSFPYRKHSKIVFGEDGLKWHFSDFSYPGKRVELNPPTYEDIDIQSYVGSFTNDEVETGYSFVEKEGKIIAQHNVNPDVILDPIAKDVFITNVSCMGRVEFTRNEKGEIDGCNISGQSAYGIRFKKE